MGRRSEEVEAVGERLEESVEDQVDEFPVKHDEVHYLPDLKHGED